MKKSPFLKRVLGGLIASILGMSALVAPVAIATPAYAAPVVISNGIHEVFKETVYGDFINVGNSVVECVSVAIPATGRTCQNFHNGVGDFNQQHLNKGYVNDVDAMVEAGSINSSSAKVQIPAGATVKHARLSYYGMSGTRSVFNCSAYNGEPASSPVMVQISNGPISQVVPDSITYDLDTQLRRYAAFVDVTENFAALPSGSPQVISVGNVPAGIGQACAAKWSLQLVYEFSGAIPDVPESHARVVSLHEGYARMLIGDAPSEFNFSGFYNPVPVMKIGYSLVDGDRNHNGDIIEYRADASGSWNPVQNPFGATNNIGISHSTSNVPFENYSNLTPFYNGSVDVESRLLTDGLSPGNTSYQLRFQTTNDGFYQTNLAFSHQVVDFSLEITPTQARTIDENAVFVFNITNNSNVEMSDFTVDSSVTLESCSGLPLGASLLGNRIIGLPNLMTAGERIPEFTCVGPAPSAGAYGATFTASANDPTDMVNTRGAVARVELLDIAMEKTASLGSYDTVGEILTYTFLVTNHGTVTVQNVGIIEDSFSGAGALGTIVCTDTILDPGMTIICTASYSITQEDIDRGSLVNTAHARAATVGSRVIDSPEDTVTVRGAQHVNLTLVKSATPLHGADQLDLPAPGSTVSYSFVVSNTGNIAVSNLYVTEVDFSGDSNVMSSVVCPDNRLEPKAQMVCTAEYIVQQSDHDRGTIANTAFASGTTAFGAVASNESTVTLPGDPRTGLKLVKSASTGSVLPGVGEQTTYLFQVMNTGNVSLSNVAITETAFDGSNELPSPTCGTATALLPGQTLTCTAEYTSAQADIDRGSVTNSAIASAVSPAICDVCVDPTSNTSTVTLAATQLANIALLKSASVDLVTAAGDEVSYSFQVTNVGNVTVREVSITEDEFTGAGVVPNVACPVFDLAPLEIMTCTASYTVVTADLERASMQPNIVNTATAYATATGRSLFASSPSTASFAVLASSPVVGSSPSPSPASTLASTGAASNFPLAVFGMLGAFLAAGFLCFARIGKRADQ